MDVCVYVMRFMYVCMYGIHERMYARVYVCMYVFNGGMVSYV